MEEQNKNIMNKHEGSFRTNYKQRALVYFKIYGIKSQNGCCIEEKICAVKLKSAHCLLNLLRNSAPMYRSLVPIQKHNDVSLMSKVV